MKDNCEKIYETLKQFHKIPQSLRMFLQRGEQKTEVLSNYALKNFFSKFSSYFPPLKKGDRGI
jgi:hypothetical protein